jgi:hypothetical protein
LLSSETNAELDAGLLLNRMLAFVPGATAWAGALVVGSVVAAGWPGAAAVGGAFGTTPAADGRDGFGATPTNLEVTERTAVTVRVTTACIAVLIADSVVGFAATSVLAVVVQPAAGDCGLLQLVNVVVDFTWQQPQSCDFAP